MTGTRWFTAQSGCTASASTYLRPQRERRGDTCNPRKQPRNCLSCAANHPLRLDFVFHDIIPPLAPQGLAAIPGGGFGQPPFIDLSWELDPDPDLSGYNVYRSETSGTAPEKKLNQDVVAAPCLSMTVRWFPV